MKSKDDHFTFDLYGNRPGRPRKLNAKTGAQRVREHRARKAQSTKEIISVSSNVNCQLCGSKKKTQCTGLCNIGQFGHKD
jgi:hypothetical protein